MRRTILIAVLSAWALISCQKSELINSGDVSGDVYSIVTDRTATKPYSAYEPTTETYREGHTNYGYGIEIQGVIWAPVNCGVGDNYEYPYGKLYQWGRSDGQPYDDEAGAPAGNDFVFGPTSAPEPEKFYFGYSDWYSGTAFSCWSMNRPSNGIGNPCPSGWRVPTISELSSLVSHHHSAELVEKVIGTTTVLGRYFDGTNNPGTNGVFLPAAGNRMAADHMANYRDWKGIYWSSDPYGSDGHSIMFIHSTVGSYFWPRGYGASVRCVRK